MAQDESVETATTKEVKPTKASIREKIFSTENKELKKEVLSFGGTEIEFRQPTIAQASELQDKDLGHDNFVVSALIAFSYIPGTNEKIFVPNDYNEICQMPLTSDFQVVMSKIADLLGLKVEEKVKN